MIVYQQPSEDVILFLSAVFWLGVFLLLRALWRLGNRK